MEPLLQHYFPADKAGFESQRERGARFPPIFYLHLWWARRPLAASRAIVAALAVDVDGTPDKDLINQFLRAIRLHNRPPRPAYNYSPDRGWVKAHSAVSEATLIDPFAGGGSLPFEALRLGYKRVVAAEYNPVAYVILKATLEYPLRYGKGLARDVRKWAEWLVEEAQRRLEKYYPPHPRGRPTNYVWVRVYKCPDGTLMPALANPLLSEDNGAALRLEGFTERGEPLLRVVRASPEEARGLATARGKKLSCLRGVLSSEELKRQYRRAMESWESKGMYGYHPAVMAAVKLEDGSYAEPTEEMLKAYRRAEEDLRASWEKLITEDLIPIEKIPKGDKTIDMLSRGLDKFYKLFNARQLLTHATIVGLVREAYNRMLSEGYEPEYAKAVTTYLALGHGKLLDYNSAITTWDPHGKGSINHTFYMHAYVFGEDFGEGDPLSDASSIYWVFFSQTGVVRALEKIVELLEGSPGSVEVRLGDAADPTLYEGISGRLYAVADPPYYDNVQYAELSDFFYVWFKRSIGHLYPEAFMWELTPKDDEIVVNRARGRDGEWFISRLSMAFGALREAGVSRLAVLYAHRSSEGLYAIFKALLDAGWKPVAVWSVASEQTRSIHIARKAAVKSMMVVAALPRVKGSGCFWDAQVRKKTEDAVEMAVSLALKLDLNWVDAIMAAIGAAFRAVGDCWPLQSLEGGELSVKALIDYAVKVAVRRFVYETLGSVNADPTSLMYLVARVIYGELEYDDARRLGYAFGVDHDSFLRRFAGKPRVTGGVKKYPVKSLIEIQPSVSPSSLVEALALAVRIVGVRGARSAAKALEDAGYVLDGGVCRYIEALRGDSQGEEKEALSTLVELCIEKHKGSNSGLGADRRVKRLDEFF